MYSATATARSAANAWLYIYSNIPCKTSTSDDGRHKLIILRSYHYDYIFETDSGKYAE